MHQLARYAFILIALLAGACARTPDAQRIRAAMEAMQQAMQARQPRDFLTHVDADFAGSNDGQDGMIDRTALGNILRVEVLRNESISVSLGPIDVDVDGNRATASVAATVTGGSGGWLPEHGAIYSIKSGWRRVGDRWLCYNATWIHQL